MLETDYPDLLCNGSDPDARASTLEAWLEQRDKHALVLRANCHSDFPEPFYGIRHLLQPLVDDPDIMTQEVANQIGAELIVIWPKLGSQTEFANCPRLTDIALAGTKRRLHKDSEQLFRLVHALSSLVLIAYDTGQVPLILVLDRLDAADRLTINTIYHIQNRRKERKVRILASADEEWLQGVGEAPWTMPGREQSERASRLYAYAIAEQCSVYGNVAGRMEKIGNDIVVMDLIQEKEPKQISANIFRILPEETSVEPRLLAIASECLNFSMHFQVAFIVLGVAHYFAEKENRNVGVDVLLLEALTLCYTGRYDMALQELEQVVTGFGLTEAEFAQAHFYMGLISQKCLNAPGRAAFYLEQGLAQITPKKSKNWRNALEYGWCSNASALVAWHSGKSTQARALVLDALRTSMPFNDPQNVNLRVNLINNLSVLAETSGDFEVAISIWETLKNASDAVGGGRLAKSFYFRRGHLRLQRGLVTEALDDFTQAAELAISVRDNFHTDIISDACGYCNVLLENYGAARSWNEIGLNNAETLGDTEGICHYRLLLAAINYFETRLPDMLLSTIEHLVQSNARMKPLEAALKQCLENESAIKGIQNLLFFPPKPKLTTPFALAHMSTPSIDRVNHSALRHNRLGALIDQMPEKQQ